MRNCPMNALTRAADDQSDSYGNVTSNSKIEQIES